MIQSERFVRSSRMADDLGYRSEFLLSVLDKYVSKEDSILEIGFGDARNLKALQEAGYKNVFGIDKEVGTPIETFAPIPHDVVFSMSCLFLIPQDHEWVFEKIADMAQKYIVTIEGETTKGNGVIGRDYQKIFEPFGFRQIEYQENVFNEYGVLRVLQKI